MTAVDDVITKITEAPDDKTALAIIHSATRRMKRAVADQLYVETEGHGDTWICKEIVKEART